MPERKTETMSGAELIAAERQRQQGKKGWTPAHDDTHDADELARAAAAYLLGSEVLWPWSNLWKPKTRVRDLVKAGALIAAEIDRLLRANGGDDA